MKPNDGNRFFSRKTNINCPSLENKTETFEHFLTEYSVWETLIVPLWKIKLKPLNIFSQNTRYGNQIEKDQSIILINVLHNYEKN